MIRSLALITLLGCTAAFLYENPKCHEGPSYWCSTPEIAESCQATSFCQQNIWTKQVEPKNVGNWVTCKACTWVFEKVEGYILNDENEDKLLAWVSKVCEKIPESYTQTCKSLVMDYGKQAIATLASKVGPSVICNALGQCSAKTLLLDLSKSESCDTCKKTMATMKQQNDELFSWWQNSCGEVNATIECVKISEYFKLLNDGLLSNDVCEEMEMC
ncbi:hypothetical protein ACHWQZ_G014000 [Mnemiopsis leidyi]